MLTKLGDALVASRMSNQSTAAPTHMAIGSGNGGTESSTTLVTESARVALTSTTQGTGGDDNLVTYVATFAEAVGTGVVSELALFNASSGGVMLNYVALSSPINKPADQPLTLTLKVRFGAST